MSLGLMLHCGAKEVDRKEINTFSSMMPEAIVKPRRGKLGGDAVWQPIDHEFLLRFTEASLLKQGWDVTDRQFGITPDGSRFFGLMQIEGKNLDGNGNTNRGYSRLIGVRNSWDKSFSAGIAAGAKVFVCDNLSFSGDVSASHRHTKNILNKLPGLITQAVSNIAEAFQFQDQRIAAYKNCELDSAGLHEKVVNLARAGCLQSSHIVSVCDEYLKPSVEHETDSKVWNLFNSVTEILKKVQPHEMCTRTQKLHKELDAVCGVKWVDITAHDRYQAEREAEAIEVAPVDVLDGLTGHN
jgi:hypothetical protein